MIRLAEEKDIKMVQALITTLAWIPLLGCLEYIKKNKIFLYEEDNKIKGLICWGKNNEKILYLIVNRKYRKNSIGKQLFNYSLTQFKPKLIKIYATFKPYDSTLFWEKLGFERKNYIKKTKARELLLMQWGKEEELWHI